MCAARRTNSSAKNGKSSSTTSNRLKPCIAQKELVAKAEDLKKNAPKLGEKATTSTSSLILEANSKQPRPRSSPA